MGFGFVWIVFTALSMKDDEDNSERCLISQNDMVNKKIL